MKFVYALNDDNLSAWIIKSWRLITTIKTAKRNFYEIKKWHTT